MKTIPVSFILAIAFSAPLSAQSDFESSLGAGFSSLLAAKGGGSAAVSGPERVQEPPTGSCEAFSVEGTMSYIPRYDQQFTSDPESDSGICYAVVAASMFDYWNLSRGMGRGELVSPLMLDLAARRRQGGDYEGGGELDEMTLYGMAREDACTLGVTAGSRQSLSVAEEAEMARQAGGKTAGRDRAGEGAAGEEGAPEASGGKGRAGGADLKSLAAGGELPCSRVEARGFSVQYMRRPRVEGPDGRTRGVNFTAQQFNSFMDRNTARQPVAVKFRYETVFGVPPRDAGSPHWALIVARRLNGGVCEYLVRNSMGNDQPQVWVEEARLIYSAASLAVLAP